MQGRRREVPVAVQSRFAQGHHSPVIGQGHDPVPIARGGLGAVVRLDPHCGVDLAVGLGQPQRGFARIGPDPDGNDRLHAGLPAPGDHRVAIGVELSLVEMGVRVYVLHGTKLGWVQ